MGQSSVFTDLYTIICFIGGPVEANTNAVVRLIKMEVSTSIDQEIFAQTIGGQNMI